MIINAGIPGCQEVPILGASFTVWSKKGQIRTSLTEWYLGVGGVKFKSLHEQWVEAPYTHCYWVGTLHET